MNETKYTKGPWYLRNWVVNLTTGVIGGVLWVASALGLSIYAPVLILGLSGAVLLNYAHGYNRGIELGIKLARWPEGRL